MTRRPTRRLALVVAAALVLLVFAVGTVAHAAMADRADAATQVTTTTVLLDTVDSPDGPAGDNLPPLVFSYDSGSNTSTVSGHFCFDVAYTGELSAAQLAEADVAVLSLVATGTQAHNLDVFLDLEIAGDLDTTPGSCPNFAATTPTVVSVAHTEVPTAPTSTGWTPAGDGDVAAVRATITATGSGQPAKYDGTELTFDVQFTITSTPGVIDAP